MNIPSNSFCIVGEQLCEGIPFGPSEPKDTVLSGYFVGLDTTQLDFNGPYAPGFYLFPGSEWHNMQPIWSVGTPEKSNRRHQREKKEVWSLPHGGMLAVADLSNGLRFLSSTSERLIIFCPEPKVVLEYLYVRAQAMALRGNTRGLNWVRQSIVAILAHYNSSEAREYLKKLVKLEDPQRKAVRA